MPCDTVANWHRPPFTNYMNDLSFRLPDNFPSARSLLDRHVRSAHIINLRSPTAISPFSCHRTTLFHGLTRAMLLEEIRRTIILDSGHRVTGSITIFS